jgi:heptosyltransferase-2
MGEFRKILVRATNWLGDAVLSLPALRALRLRFPEAEIAVVAKPWVAGLYAGESAVTRTILYPLRSGARDLVLKFAFARQLRAERFDCAILFQNAFEAAVLARLAGIPRRIGYDRDGRGRLLTDAIPVPRPGETPPHQRFYYLELLRRAGLNVELPEGPICLEKAALARKAGMERFRQRGIQAPVVGISPGAAYGSAKRWLPERFAEAGWRLASDLAGSVAVFGASAERTLGEAVCLTIQSLGGCAHNLAGATSLAEFMEAAAACDLFLTNDSGAMHVASALGVPTVAIFGSTDAEATGPAGPHTSVIREPVECSPCLLRECPIDHRCMTRITTGQVVAIAQKWLHARL